MCPLRIGDGLPNLMIALMEEGGGKLDPEIASSFGYVKNETPKRCVKQRFGVLG